MVIKEVQKSFKANYRSLCLSALIASMGMFQLGYVYTATNQTASVLDAQFGLTTKEQQKLYHTVIGSSAVLGAAIGSFAGGKLI